MFDAIVDIYGLESSGIADAPDIGSGIARANGESAVSYSETDIFGRYSYISNPTIINPGTNNETDPGTSDIGNTDTKNKLLGIAYNVTLQNAFKEALSPLFATMISGSIGPEGENIDLNNLPFLDQVPDQSGDSRKTSAMSKELLPPFSWRRKAVGERLSLAVLGVSPEEEALKALNSFSYLSIPSLDSSDDVVVGLINPDGTSARKRSFTPLGYSAEKVDYGVWKISFDENFQKIPTLIAQPTWISHQEDLPKSNAQVSLAVKECTLSNCLIYLGCNNTIGNYSSEATPKWTQMIPDEVENAFVNEHLGLSFLAIDGNFNGSSMVHGIVNSESLDINGTLTGKNWMATKKLSGRKEGYIIPPSVEEEGAAERMMEYNQTFLWAEIEFDEPFLDPPTLLVTPTFEGDNQYQNRSDIWPERFLSGSNPFNDVTYYDQDDDQKKAAKVQVTTFASVEYVTKRRALIKVGVIDTWGLMRWSKKCLHHISFSFLAVGPMGKRISSDEDVQQQAPKRKRKLKACSKRGKGGKGTIAHSSATSTYSKEKDGITTPVSAPSPTAALSPPPSKSPSLRGTRGERTSSPPSSNHDKSLNLWLP